VLAVSFLLGDSKVTVIFSLCLQQVPEAVKCHYKDPPSLLPLPQKDSPFLHATPFEQKSTYEATPEEQEQVCADFIYV
jgi:hypothetical protein